MRQLRYFSAIVDEGSFSRAAARLGVAQPALSLHVRRMEEALGAPLLVRGPHGVVPTEAGDLLLRRARALIADFDRTQEEIRNFGRAPAGTVRLGLPGTISGILSVPLIARCRERYPHIKIIVAEAMSGFVLEWLVESRIELAVVYTDARDDGLHSEVLLEEELVALLPPHEARDESETREETASLETLAGWPLIVPSGAHGLRIMLDTHFRSLGVEMEPAFEVDSFANIKRLVESGYGCSVLPLHAVAEEARTGRLTVQHLTEPRLWRRAYLACAASRPLTRAARLVNDLLTEVVRDLIATGSWAGARRLDPRPGEIRKTIAAAD